MITETTNIYNQMTSNINEKMKIDFKNIQLIKHELINNNILWIQFSLYDENILPIKVDILTNIFSLPTKNIYLLPGTGLNTESNFIIPTNNSIAIYLANKSYTVIGITPREDALPQDFNFELIKDWGLQKHTDDVNKVIKLFQSINNINYEILGHSAGALIAFNHASNIDTKNKKLKALRIIDVVGEYEPNSQKFTNAQLSLNASNQLINAGVYVNPDISGMKFLCQASQLDPNGDSGIPRPVPGGNFTNIGLLHFSLIYTGQLPGIMTDITGLPGSWFLDQGFLSGTYQFGELPTDDIFTLNHTDINTIYNAVSKIGSGLYPLSYERDFYSLMTNSFPIIWENIKIPVFYVNVILGFGVPSYTFSLLVNTTVTLNVIQDYGHADCVYSNTAETDFWNLLFP